MRAPSYVLCVGDEAWCLLVDVHKRSRSTSPNARTLIGAARVRVDAVHADGFDVTATGANPTWYAGRQLTLPRADLYAKGCRAERREFGALVERFWPRAAAPARKEAPCR